MLNSRRYRPSRAPVALLLGLCLAWPGSAVRGDERKDLRRLTLEELLNTTLTVATKNPSNIRETPGVVTLVMREELLNMGARDLMDVLRMVPGFDFGVDTQGATGIATRGNWGHEGKILLLVDGQEFNETLYSTLQFGRHFPVDNIQRLEIIRGPGSAIYGGNAELAVINVITRSGEDLNGGYLSTAYSQMTESYGQRSLNAAFGRRSGDANYSLAATVSQGNRSDRVFTDFYGNSFDMTGNSKLDLFNVNFGLTYKGLGVRAIVDRYHTTEGDVYAVAAPEGLMCDFDTWLLEAKYDIKLREDLKLTPRFNYRRHSPWISDDERARSLEEEFPDLYGGNLANRTAERFIGNLTAAYDPTPKINVLAGFEGYSERATDNLPDGTFLNGDKTVKFSNVAFFAQGLLKTPVADIAIGARVDSHSEFGSEFVPRFGLTRVIDRFHVKALASQAFRAPGIENIDLNRDIRPEKTTVIEFEAGYRLGAHSLLTANVYDIRIKDPIVFFYDIEDLESPESYINFTKTGTRGIEIEHRFSATRGYLNTTYSYYKAVHNEVPDYAVPGNDALMLAFPAHKLTMNGHLTVHGNISLNPSLVYMSKRYGYNGLDESGENPTLARFDPVTLLNLNVIYSNILGSGVTVSAGVFDLLDQKYSFIQPYSGGFKAPLPDRTREVIFRVSYSFGERK